MMKSINKFWTEYSGDVCSGAVAVAITLALLTTRYMQYFVL